MNKLLLIGALLLTSGVFAQNLVSTSPQNKKVVLEQFTGIRCGYCPGGHTTSQAIKADNPNDVFLIYVHTGSYANPSGNRPDFRTSFGEALATQANATNYPTGTVNRKGRARSRGSWERYVNQTLLENSYVNVASKADINTITNELTVTVEVYYTGDSPESVNKLNVALLQDNTVGYQYGADPRNTYNHMHRLVHLLTGQWGENITNTSQGDFSEFTYTYQIPEDYNEVEVFLEDLKLVVFVAEGQQEILTATKIVPNFIDDLVQDVAIKKIKRIPSTCLDRITPQIEIKNLGGEALTSLDITYSVNGGNSKTHTWTGNINPLAKKTITLEEISFTPNDQGNIIEVSIPNDDDNDNNTKSRTFQSSIEGSIYSTLQIETLATGSTTTWEIKNISGEVIYSGGLYNDFTTYTIDLELLDGCYEISIEDTEGLGKTMFTIEDDGGIVLFTTETDYGNSIRGDFRTNSLLSLNEVLQESIILYPNPTNGVITIENAEGFQVEVYDIVGKRILSKAAISKQETINFSSLTAGIYYVKLQNENTTEVKKIVVK